MSKASLYQIIWRWHFYAGLFVIPFVMILSVTGAIYLFKPQLDYWQDSDMRNLASTNIVSVDEQFDAMRVTYPDAHFHHYRPPINRHDAAIFHIGLDENIMRDIYVSPQGKIIAVKRPDDRISSFVSRIHGTLLLGNFGRYLVELAASWAIIMIITGLYLWWPRNKKYTGILLPRMTAGKKIFWRDMHAVTGFYASGLVLILLLTGLPWTQVWASGFNMVRTEIGWINNVEQDWHVSEHIVDGINHLHIEHDHKSMMVNAANASSSVTTPYQGLQKNSISFEKLDAISRTQALHYPVIIKPQKPINNMDKMNTPYWEVSSQTQNRTLRKSIIVNGDGEIIDKKSFADRHIIDQIISYGISWHEGQLLGWFNQLIGLFTAIALLIISASGIKMWWARRSSNLMQYDNNFMGAPPMIKAKSYSKLPIVIIIVCALLLPMIGLSILCVLVFDYFVFGNYDSI